MAATLIVWLSALPLLGGVAATGPKQFTVTLMEYRVADPDSALMAAYELPKERMLEAFARVQRRLEVTVTGQAGEVMRVEHELLSGTVKVEAAGGDRLRVTLELPRFFKGTPLLISRCGPHVVVRTRARVQNRVQLTVRAIEVRGRACSTIGPAPPRQAGR